jgi:hypothetical protein
LNLPGLWRPAGAAPSFFHDGQGASLQRLRQAQTRACEVMRMISPCVRVGGSLVLTADAGSRESWQPWLDGLSQGHFVELRWRTRAAATIDTLGAGVAQALAAASAVLPPHLTWLLSAGAGIWQADDAHARARLQALLGGVHQAVQDGLPLRGFLYAAAFDQYEWTQGYARRRGLVAVHPDTLLRTVRPLARWYGSVSRTGTLPESSA